MEAIAGSSRRIGDIIGVIDGVIDHMTQQNAALVEQSAAAAESLNDHAQRLAEKVAVFRTGD